MVKEFVLIEREEYDRIKDNPSSNENEIVSDTTPGSSMLSTSHLLSAVKNKVGIMYHNKVERLFEFLKSHPSLLTWTDFGEAIVNGIHLPPQGLDKLIPVLFQNGFDPQNVVNKRLKVFSHASEVCKRPSLVKKKQRTVHKQGIKWSIY